MRTEAPTEVVSTKLPKMCRVTVKSPYNVTWDVLNDTQSEELSLSFQRVISVIRGAGGRAKDFLCVGSNAVMRALEEDRCQCVVIANDVKPFTIVQYIPVMAALGGCPFAVCQKSEGISAAVGMRRVAAIGILTHPTPQGGAPHPVDPSIAAQEGIAPPPAQEGAQGRPESTVMPVAVALALSDVVKLVGSFAQSPIDLPFLLPCKRQRPSPPLHPDDPSPPLRPEGKTGGSCRVLLSSSGGYGGLRALRVGFVDSTPKTSGRIPRRSKRREERKERRRKEREALEPSKLRRVESKRKKKSKEVK